MEAYEAIEADIDSQKPNGDFDWKLDGNRFYCKITNNTKHTFNTTFEMYFKDSNDTIIESTIDYIENIKPNQSYEVSFYIGNLDRVATYEWFNYYDSVKY